jgi:hypothetical protein
MTGAGLPGRGTPVLLVKWYDLTRWLLERIDIYLAIITNLQSQSRERKLASHHFLR